MEEIHNVIFHHDYESEKFLILLQKSLIVMYNKYISSNAPYPFLLSMYSIFTYIITGNSKYISSDNGLKYLEF